MEKLYIIKIGGNIIDDEARLASFLKAFAAIDGLKILVHGGGKLATRVAEAMHIPQQLQDGRRVTDAETLKVVTMVYAGFINKTVVAQLQANGCNAFGVSGADGNLIKAHKRIHPVTDYGFVGDVDEINTDLVASLLQRDLSLVCSPITHDGSGQLLNTNADTIAQEMAKALSGTYEVSLVYCFEKRGVLMNADDDTSVIHTINKTVFQELKDKQVVHSGMLPKLQNAFAALDAGVSVVSIGRADDLSSLISRQSGTAIVHE